MVNRIAVSIVFLVLSLAGLACTFSAAVDDQPIIDIAPAEATSTPVLPTTAEPVSVTSTPLPAGEEPAAPTSTPHTLDATFSDPVNGYAFDYPAEWYRTGEPGEGAVVLLSTPPSAPGGGELPEGTAKIDVIPPSTSPGPHPSTLEEFIAQVDAQREDPAQAFPDVVVSEETWMLAGGIPAIRRTLDAPMAGRVAALYTVINGKPFMMIGYGDLTRFDEIARTLRPAE